MADKKKELFRHPSDPLPTPQRSAGIVIDFCYDVRLNGVTSYGFDDALRILNSQKVHLKDFYGGSNSPRDRLFGEIHARIINLKVNERQREGLLAAFQRMLDSPDKPSLIAGYRNFLLVTANYPSVLDGLQPALEALARN